MAQSSGIFLCGQPLATCLETIRGFHGWEAPGLVLGLLMVDWARERIGARVEADALVETRHCLPDAVQLFTPCTVGNGWLKVLDWDQFALTLYDRHTRQGQRVWVDLAKAAAFPDLTNWFLRRVPKASLPLERLNAAILAAGRRALSAAAVELRQHHQRHKKGPTAVCPRCGEAYAARLGPLCPACSGAGYWRPAMDRANPGHEAPDDHHPHQARP
jgi:formylmethanofuran dehydrogenase subunit E